MRINYIKTRAKLTLKEELIPRTYFFTSTYSPIPTFLEATQEEAIQKPIQEATQEATLNQEALNQANTSSEIHEKKTIIAAAATTTPVSYFTEYELYFKALSPETLLALLFYSKDIEYELGITDFTCVQLPDSQILQEFPLADSFNQHLSKDLRRFQQLLIFPDKIELIHFYDRTNTSTKVNTPRNSSTNKHVISLYVLRILDKIWLYIHNLEFNLNLESQDQTQILEFDVLDIHYDQYLKYIKNNHKVVIDILPRSDYLSDVENRKSIVERGISGIMEIRTDGKLLIYHSDLHGFFPGGIKIKALILPT